MKELIIATKNKGKVAEFKAIFESFDINILSLYDIAETTDVEETGRTFQENAQLKAEEIAKLLNKPVLADDSGLVIPALDGRPGVYSARYAGDNASDKKNNEKVLKELARITENSRDAYFQCVLALAIPNKATIFTEGRCAGKIAIAPSGENGFGYDPIFIPQGYDVTMAHLTQEEKNTLSHRYNALIEMKQWLDRHIKKGVLNE